MNNYQTWLETPDIVRMALVQVEVSISGVLSTKYLSTHMATVSNQTYLPVISGDITLDESLSLEYTSNISYGDIEIINTTGEFDAWIDYVWVNKSIKIYIGSVPEEGTTASLSDYELIFDGIVSGIDLKDRNHLNLKIRDKLEKLNTSVSEELLGNYHLGQIVSETSGYLNQYRNNLKPICYGEVHNITPLLTDSSMLEYMVNSSSVESIIEVRDNGVPVPMDTTGTPPAGSFRLAYAPAGTITCSVQGVNRTINLSGTDTATYLNTASNTILDILKYRGRFLTNAEIDSVSFSTLGTQSVGVYLTSRVNVLNICQDIAKDCGLVLSVSRLGKVGLIDFSIPTSTTNYITESDMFLNSLTISNTTDVIAAVKLGYAKNWTVQDNLITGIPMEHKDYYKTEWLESVKSDATTKTTYGISTEPVLEDTYLINKTEADAVCLKKLNLFKVPRKVFSMKCTAKWLSLEIGDSVKITSSRFGLSSGKFGIVTSTKPNWLKGYIIIEVLV